MKQSYSILIIDDEIYIRDSMADYFRDEGYIVAVAESGEEALNHFKKRRFHICIVDIRLSGMDGTKTIERIKKLDPQSRILVFTGSLEFQITGELTALGLKESHVIYKPINSLDVLGDKVKELGFGLED